ncbi:MAG: hypothetical protein EXS25_05145 [Pedosphaera sp.]|nr:hypothetical protein [Pedosphaera sp.]
MKFFATALLWAGLLGSLLGCRPGDETSNSVTKGRTLLTNAVAEVRRTAGQLGQSVADASEKIATVAGDKAAVLTDEAAVKAMELQRKAQESVVTVADRTKAQILEIFKSEVASEIRERGTKVVQQVKHFGTNALGSAKIGGESAIKATTNAWSKVRVEAEKSVGKIKESLSK